MLSLRVDLFDAEFIEAVAVIISVSYGFSFRHTGGFWVDLISGEYWAI